MTRLVVKRLAISIVTMWAVTVIVFVGTEILPGDVAQAILGNPQHQRLWRASQPAWFGPPRYVRYLSWLGGFTRGDLGISLSGGTPISGLIKERLGNTLLLAGITASVAVPLALLIGALAAMFPGSVFDRAVSVTTLYLVAMPDFLIASILVLIFAVELGWLPAIAYMSASASWGRLLSSIAMPVAPFHSLFLPKWRA